MLRNTLLQETKITDFLSEMIMFDTEQQRDFKWKTETSQRLSLSAIINFWAVERFQE